MLSWDQLLLGLCTAVLTIATDRIIRTAFKPSANSASSDSAPEDSSDEDEDNEEVGGKSDGLPASFYTDPLKMVLCVRTDLKMKKGKMCAQCGHASVGAYKRCAKKMKRVVDRWNLDGAKKIAVKVSSEEQLMELAEQAKEKSLIRYVVVDAGKTQVKANSVTVLAIGPGPASVIDTICGDLKLL